MYSTRSNSHMVHMVNLMMRVHRLMQKIIWEGGLLQEEERYRALRTVLKTPNLQGILDMLWLRENENPQGSYRRTVIGFIKEFSSMIPEDLYDDLMRSIPVKRLILEH
jgi:hypothetical protein